MTIRRTSWHYWLYLSTFLIFELEPPVQTSLCPYLRRLIFCWAFWIYGALCWILYGIAWLIVKTIAGGMDLLVAFFGDRVVETGQRDWRGNPVCNYERVYVVSVFGRSTSPAELSLIPALIGLAYWQRAIVGDVASSLQSSAVTVGTRVVNGLLHLYHYCTTTAPGIGLAILGALSILLLLRLFRHQISDGWALAAAGYRAWKDRFCPTLTFIDNEIS